MITKILKACRVVAIFYCAHISNVSLLADVISSSENFEMQLAEFATILTDSRSEDFAIMETAIEPLAGTTESANLRLDAGFWPAAQETGTSSQFLPPFVKSTGRFDFGILADAGSHYIIESSSDLLHWSAVLEFDGTGSSLPFLNVVADEHLFYRIKGFSTE